MMSRLLITVSRMFAVVAVAGSMRATNCTTLIPSKATRAVNRGRYAAGSVANLATYGTTEAWSILGASGTTWGIAGDISVVGDFDGDGLLDVAVFRRSTATWYIIPSGTGVAYWTTWGIPGDVPVPADYDGDGKTDIAVWRPSNGTWYVIPSKPLSMPYSVTWGLPGDMPVLGDFDGDGKSDIAIFRPSNAGWYIIPSSTGIAYAIAWGSTGDIPVPADFDGDCKTDLAVYTPSTGVWNILPSSSGIQILQMFGGPGYAPVALDYDGDGKADYVYWNPSDVSWHIMQSSGGTVTKNVGIVGDTPVYRPWVQSASRSDLTYFQTCIGPSGTASVCILAPNSYSVTGDLTIGRSNFTIMGGDTPSDTVLVRGNYTVGAIMIPSSASITNVTIAYLTFDGNRYGVTGLNCQAGNNSFSDLRPGFRWTSGDLHSRVGGLHQRAG